MVLFVTGGPGVLYYVEQEPNPQLKGNCFISSVYIYIFHGLKVLFAK